MKFRILFLALLIIGCGKIKDAKKAVDSVKEFSKDMKDISESTMALKDIDLEKITLEEKEVRSFFKNVKRLNKKYPEIHFQIAQTAVLEATNQGEELKQIIKDETDMSFQDYSKISAVVAFAELKGASLELSKSMYEQLISSKEAMQLQLEKIVDEKQKEELRSTLEQTENDINELKTKLESPEYQKKLHNYNLIKKIKIDMDI